MMTLSEFKYWLEGFEASFVDGKPTKEQYELIKEKLELAYLNSPLPYYPIGIPQTKPEPLDYMKAWVTTC